MNGTHGRGEGAVAPKLRSRGCDDLEPKPPLQPQSARFADESSRFLVDGEPLFPQGGDRLDHALVGSYSHLNYFVGDCQTHRWRASSNLLCDSGLPYSAIEVSCDDLRISGGCGATSYIELDEQGIASPAE